MDYRLPNTSPLRPLEFTGVGGLRLAAEAAGESDAPPVLLLHGGGQTHHAWAQHCIAAR